MTDLREALAAARKIVDEWIEMQREGWTHHHCQHGTTCAESFNVAGMDAVDRDALIQAIAQHTQRAVEAEREQWPKENEDDRQYARRIVQLHQHAHGPREVRPNPARCPDCRSLIDTITHAMAVIRLAAYDALRARAGSQG